MQNNKVIYEKDSQEIRYPASLTKIMTLYISFMALKSGMIQMTDMVTVSQKASKAHKSKIGFKPGEKVSVEDLIRSLIVVSANDSAIVLGEHIAGSEEKFVKIMNRIAKNLGMEKTLFQNTHGLHNILQYTTARDISKLAIALKRDFPEYYHLFSLKSFIWKNKTYGTHNVVNLKYQWANGLKTGYTNASGYNIASTASKNGEDILVVIMNTRNKLSRDQYAIDMLEYGFAAIEYGHLNATKL